MTEASCGTCAWSTLTGEPETNWLSGSRPVYGVHMAMLRAETVNPPLFAPARATRVDGASYDKLLFIISDENEKLRTFILEDLERSATFIKARGMYSEEEKDMIFLVVDRKEVHAVQRKVQEIDPKAFFVVTDAYDTYGEGFKPFPEAGAIQAQ